MLYVAHRFGNSIEKLHQAEETTALVEVDVHVSAAGVEVRHAKRLWPTRRLWERWYLLPKGAKGVDLSEILTAAAPTTRFWFDLKGVARQLGERVLNMVPEEHEVILSTKAWWLLGRYSGRAGVRTMRSAGNRFELALLLWLPSRTKIDGAVVHSRLLSPRVVDMLSRRGDLFTWSVEDEGAVERLRALGVSGIIVDDLNLAEGPAT